MTYDEAFALLRKYNSEPFHITHALTVSNVMRRMADELGYGDEADFWAVVGLLHDIDFERWPTEHCKKCVELLREGGADDEQIVSERQRIRAELDREMPGVSVAGHS